jgi:hypothetical protein
MQADYLGSTAGVQIKQAGILLGGCLLSKRATASRAPAKSVEATQTISKVVVMVKRLLCLVIGGSDSVAVPLMSVKVLRAC